MILWYQSKETTVDNKRLLPSFRKESVWEEAHPMIKKHGNVVFFSDPQQFCNKEVQILLTSILLNYSVYEIQ